MSAPRKVLTREAAWVLVCREQPSAYERSILGLANTAEAVHEIVRDRILAETVEVMYVLCLDGRNRVTHLAEVARGGLHGCAIHARDILRIPVMAAASAFVLVHNHPSGDPTPSPDDIEMTRKVAAAAAVVGVQLVDHLVIGSWHRFESLYQLGLLETPS